MQRRGSFTRGVTNDPTSPRAASDSGSHRQSSIPVDKTYVFHDPVRAAERAPAGYGHLVRPGRGWGAAVRHGEYPQLDLEDDACPHCERALPNPTCHVCGFGEPAQHHPFAPLVRESKPLHVPDALARALGTSKNLIEPEKMERRSRASRPGHFERQVTGRLTELTQQLPHRRSNVSSYA